MTVQFLCEELGVALNQTQAKIFLAIEVMIERPLGNADTAQNLVDARRGKTLFRENFQAGAQKQFARVAQVVTLLGRSSAAARGMKLRVHALILDRPS